MTLNLKDFLSEHCRPACKHMVEANNFFFRGISPKSTNLPNKDTFNYGDVNIGGKIGVVQRESRKPRNTPQYAHDLIDKWFLDTHGIAARSKGMFVTNSQAVAEDYGLVTVIVPMGEYQTVHSPTILDLTEHLYPDTIDNPAGGDTYWELIGFPPNQEDQEEYILEEMRRSDYVLNDPVSALQVTKGEIALVTQAYAILAIPTNGFGIQDLMQIMKEIVDD